jgi:hypothetical protein
VTSLATLSGRPVQLPAGKVALTAKAGFAYSALRGSNNQGTAGSNLKRGDTSFGANLGIPITSTREHVLEALGDMTPISRRARLSFGFRLAGELERRADMEPHQAGASGQLCL